mmetsp:Transcript_31419/g.94320  ORF Transcript_31419/g.94320 Transcript_31419/m.94320 type:complete len:243 (-) Transcript_31419:325-1053(-)
MASSHSSMSISPSLLVSSASRAFERRAGCRRNWRFASPQDRRNWMTILSLVTALTISSFVKVPESSLSMSWKHSRAALRNSAVNSSISLRSAAAAFSRCARRCSSLALSAASMACSHSHASISPSLSVSSWFRANSRRAGTSRYCRFGLPQLTKKSITFWSDDTAWIISCFTSVPLLSTSIMSKTIRAMERNSAENASSAAASARARRSCSALRSSMRFARPRWIASSHSSMSSSPEPSVSR